MYSSALTPITFTHHGSGNFVVKAYGSANGEDLLVNEIGHYSGQVALPTGSVVLSITADGAWTASLGQ